MVLIGAIVIGLANRGGDDAVEPTPTTITLEGQSAVETALRWHERFEAGDVEGYEALMSQDVTFSCDPCGDWPPFPLQPYFADPAVPAFWQQVSAQTYMAGGSLAESSCAETSATVATCDVILDLGELEVVGAGPVQFSQVFTVIDGVITELTQSEFTSGGDFSSARLNEYADWLSGTYPDDYAALFAEERPTFDTQAQRDQHAARFQEWSGAGRPAAPVVPTTVAFDRPAESLWDLIQAEPDLSTFTQAIEAGGLVEFMSSCDQDVTVMAPTNNAISQVEDVFGTQVLTDDIAEGNQPQLTQFINDHLLAGSFDLEGLGRSASVWVEHTTLANKPVRIGNLDPSTTSRGISGGQFGLDSGFACNGVLHKLDLPVGF